jgi:glycine betaine/proline transport system ATP-binding protein
MGDGRGNGMTTETRSDVAIEIIGVWKVFGAAADKAMADIRETGISKQDVLAKYDCVIGVADVSLKINRGEIFCIMGLSGSGKSTLVRHINRLLEPSAGKISVHGRNILKLNASELRKYRNEHISMVFQNFALMPHRSVIDNVALPLEIRGVPKNKRIEIAQQALDMVDLQGWNNKFAHELSGGMQQRVGLARAIAVDSEILLMDEPFSALDPLIRRQLQGEFMKLAAMMNKTTVFITHDLDEAVRIGHRIAIMRDGRVVQVGSAEEIVMNPADDYVAAFVAGISRFKVVKAHSVMHDFSTFEAANGPIPDTVPSFDEGTYLNELMKDAAASATPIRITRDNKPVGVIDRAALLQAIVKGMGTE